MGDAFDRPPEPLDAAILFGGPERDKVYREALSEAVKAGATVLDRGGSSLDAVEAAARVMEDDPHFNAAQGAVFTTTGTTELDAAIMDGATLHAGAVAGVWARAIRSPWRGR